MNKNLKIYEYAKSCIGKNLAPIYKELGCAEAVNNVFIQAIGEDVGGGASTNRMYNSLLNDARFQILETPELGCIVLSPSGYGNGKIKNGHVGIYSDNDKIMSNSSDTLKWAEHYTLVSWFARYGKIGGFPTRFFALRYDRGTPDKVEDQKVIEELTKKVGLLTRLVELLKQLLKLTRNKLGNIWRKN